MLEQINNSEGGFSVRTKLNNMFAELYGFITSIFNTKADKTAVLLKDNTIVYVPTEDYHPATKKTVTDAIGSLSSSRIQNAANTNWIETGMGEAIYSKVSVNSSSNGIYYIFNNLGEVFSVEANGTIKNIGGLKLGQYSPTNIPTKEEGKIIYMTGTPGEFSQEGLHICKNNNWIPIDTYFRRPSTLEKLYTQTGIKDLRIFDNAYGLTQVYLKNTNDTADYAGAVLSLEGSGAEYTNFMSMGKYGALFYITNWRGKGVVASDKNMILSSTNGTNGQIEFEVGGSMSAPTRRFVMENDGTLAALTANYQNLVTSDNDMTNKKYVDDRVVVALSKSYYTATVGTGGDYIDHRLAYAAGHRRVIQISNVTETASPNFATGGYYEITTINNTLYTWYCDYALCTVFSGTPWKLKINNIKFYHTSTITGAIAYCNTLELYNSIFRINRTTLQPFSVPNLQLIADNSTFEVPQNGITLRLNNEYGKASKITNCVITYWGTYLDEFSNCPIFDCNNGFNIFENIQFVGERLNSGFNNVYKSQFKNAIRTKFYNIYTLDPSNSSFFIENPLLFSGGSGNGVNLYNPQTVENVSGKIYVQYNSASFNFPTLKSVYEADLYITINQIVSPLGNSSVVDTILNVYIAPTALSYGNFSGHVRVENGSFKLYGITTAHHVILNRFSFNNTYIELLGEFPNLKLMNSTIMGGKIAETLNCIDSGNIIKCQDTVDMYVYGNRNTISCFVTGLISLETASYYNIVSMCLTSYAIANNGNNNLVSNNLME